MRAEAITQSLNLPFSLIIIKYDYYIDSKNKCRLIDKSNMYIDRLRVISKDAVLAGTNMGTLHLINLLTNKRHIFKGEDTFFRFELLPQVNQIVTTQTRMIKIWDLNSLETPQSMFKIDDFAVEIFILPKNKFIIYNKTVPDKDINIYDSHGLVTTLYGHNLGVTSFALMGNKLISAAYGEFKIWNLDTEELEATLYGHTREINTIIVTDTLWYSGSDDKIIVWNYTQLIKTIHTDYEVKKIISIGDRLLSTDLKRNITVWTRKGKCIATLQHKHKDVKLLPNHQLVIISKDGFVIWDPEENKIVSQWKYAKLSRYFDVVVLSKDRDGKLLLVINNNLAIF